MIFWFSSMKYQLALVFMSTFRQVNVI